MYLTKLSNSRAVSLFQELLSRLGLAAAGDTARASQIEASAAGFNQAPVRLKTLRSKSSKLAAMEAELEELGDANGVAVLTSQRETMNREIAGIEDNLSQVRAALCR